MLKIQRKSFFGTPTFAFLVKGEVIAHGVNGIRFSEMVAKMFGNTLPVEVLWANDDIQPIDVCFQAVKPVSFDGGNFFGSLGADICMVVKAKHEIAFSIVPLIDLMMVKQPNVKAVKEVRIRDDYALKLIAALTEHSTELEMENLVEFLNDLEHEQIRLLARFFGCSVTSSTHPALIEFLLDTTLDEIQDRCSDRNVQIDECNTLVDMYKIILASEEKNAKINDSLSFDEEEDFDFEDDEDDVPETFSEAFDGDAHDSIGEDEEQSEDDFGEDDFAAN